MSIVSLVSGGFDSTVMSLMAHEAGATLFPLFIDYGQLGAEKEWEACQALHEKYALPLVTRMDLSGFGSTVASGITDSRLRVNEDAFLPGRNLLFLLMGASFAVHNRADAVAIGLLNPASHLFPDQTSAFIESAEAIIATALGRRIQVLTPLMEFRKGDILAMAQTRGLTGTYSCHSGGATPCGVCIACQEILNA